MPQAVLDVVAKDVEVEHVAREVHEAPVEKHAGEDREHADDRIASRVKAKRDEADHVINTGHGREGPLRRKAEGARTGGGRSLLRQARPRAAREAEEGEAAR